MSPKKSWDTLDSATCARWKRSPDRGLPGAEPAQEVAPKGQDALGPRGCRPCLRLGHPDLMIEGRPAKLGQPARESPEPVEKRRLNLETALASRLHERGNDVMRSRILGPHLVQKPLDDQLDDLLGSAGGEIPSPTRDGVAQLPRDGLRLGQKPVGAFAVRHSSMVSPGRQSGFRSQYQVPSGRSMRREPSCRSRCRTASSPTARTPSGSKSTTPWCAMSSRIQGWLRRSSTVWKIGIGSGRYPSAASRWYSALSRSRRRRSRRASKNTDTRSRVTA